MVKVRTVRIGIGTVTETENDSSSGKTDFQPNGIKVRRFKSREPCNRCIDVIVCTNSSLGTKTRNEVVVRDLKGVSGSIIRNLSLGEQKYVGERGSNVVLNRGKIGRESTDICVVDGKRDGAASIGSV